MSNTRIADLSVDEFKNLIREVVAETILDLLNDPDNGLELQESVVAQMQQSIAAVEEGGKTIPARKVVASVQAVHETPRIHE